MISPEVLRWYPFFSFMNPNQLREVAMITEEITIEEGEILFKIEEKANSFFLLRDGLVDLQYTVVDEHEPELRKDFIVGSVNPGEVVGISAIIVPHEYTTSAITVRVCQLLKIDAVALRKLSQEDRELYCGLQTVIAKTALERLHDTRIQLAAAST